MWWAISVPLRQQIPTWTGQGDPSVCVRGLEGHDPCVGGWKIVANLTAEPAAAHFETTRPNTEPTTYGNGSDLTERGRIAVLTEGNKPTAQKPRSACGGDAPVEGEAHKAHDGEGSSTWDEGITCIE